MLKYGGQEYWLTQQLISSLFPPVNLGAKSKKRMKYELTVIVPGRLDDKEAATTVAQVKDLIVKHEGKVVSEHNWGRRTFTYPILKDTTGHYATFEYEAPGEAVAQIERDLRLGNLVVRFLTTTAYKEPVALVDHVASAKPAEDTRSAEEILRRSGPATPKKKEAVADVAEEADEDVRQAQLDEALGKLLEETPTETNE